MSRAGLHELIRPSLLSLVRAQLISERYLEASCSVLASALGCRSPGGMRLVPGKLRITELYVILVELRRVSNASQ
jgi:hypothetical protein